MSEDSHPLTPNMRFIRQKHALRKVEYNTSPRLKRATRELHELQRVARSFDIDSLPRVLQMKVGDKEFTSIRRLEGNRIPTENQANSDPYFRLIRHKVDSKYIHEGHVGILFLPSLWGAEADTAELDEYLQGVEDYDAHRGWGTLLPHALYKGIPFKFNEWKLSGSSVGVVIRMGGKLYVGGVGARSVIVEGGDMDYIQVARVVKPDHEGKITLSTQSYWWTDQEFKVQERLNENLGKLYVMVQGFSERQRISSTTRAPSKKLEPVKVKVD